jgi:hypothetical protein
MYDLGKVEDFNSFLREVYIPANPLKVCDDNGRLTDPQFDEQNKYVGRFFTPDEYIARLQRIHGVFSDGGIDPISAYGHGWELFQRGMDPRGVAIQGAVQNQTPDDGKKFTIQGTPEVIMVVPAEELKSLNTKLDAIDAKVSLL